MKWTQLALAAAVLAPLSSYGSDPPKPQLHYNEDDKKFTLTSATAPPPECLPPAPAAAPKTPAAPKAKTAAPAAKAANKQPPVTTPAHAPPAPPAPAPPAPPAPAPPAPPAPAPPAPPAPAPPAPGPGTYTLDSISGTCLRALGIAKSNITLTGDGFVDDNKNPVKVQHVFGPTGKELANPPPVDEQGPLLLVLADHTVVVVDSLKAAETHSDTTVLTCPDNAFARAHDADVEIDLLSGSVIKNPPRNVVSPNEGLVVYVCHDPSKYVTVDWGGSRGMTRADIVPTNQSQGKGGDKAPPAPKPGLSRYAFAPRQAGSADLKVWASTDTTHTPDAALELEVEPLYWGAVRFGLGTLFGSWRSYEIATFSGSRQQEVRSDTQNATFELVSGFAPYVLDDYLWNGRSQSGGHDAHVAPFFGFGVLGTTPNQGVQGLSSVHLGIEYEVADNFSIAATAVYRRSKTLANGYAVGSPVESGMTLDNITVDNWSWGFAVVVNATPSFLQFAAGTTGTSSSDKSGGGK